MVQEQFRRKDAYVSNLIRRKARAICRESRSLGFDVEDIEQDLWTHLVEHEARFDSGRACFETFADRVIENKVKSILRHLGAQKRDARREEFSLDDVVQGFDVEPGARHETIPSRTSMTPDCQDVTEDLKTLLSQLHATERAIVKALHQGTPKRCIRQQLGMSRRQFDRRLTHIRDAARSLGLSDYLS